MRQSMCILGSLVFAVSAMAVFGADRKIMSPLRTKPGGNHSKGVLVDGTLYTSGHAVGPENIEVTATATK